MTTLLKYISVKKGRWFVLKKTTEKISFDEIIDAASYYSVIREEVRRAISTLNPVEIVTPEGISEIKKDWIKKARKGVFENPKFSYDRKKLKEVSSKAEMLKDLKIRLIYRDHEGVARGFAWELIYSALHDAIATVDLAEAILRHDDFEAGRMINMKYGISDDSMRELAHRRADDISRLGLNRSENKSGIDPGDFELLSTSKIRACEIKQMLERMMNEYGSTLGWPVEIIENGSEIMVCEKSSLGHPAIVVPVNRKMNGWKLVELLGREIECHWRSSINAELIGALKVDDELVYEGLAAAKDNRFSSFYFGEEKWPVPYYILAQELALEGKSFAEVASQIYMMLPESVSNREKKSWNYTYKTFRGVSNTQNPAAYAFTKDRAAFEGGFYANQLRMRGVNHYLSFGTLKKEQLERLIELTKIEEIEKSVLPDRKLQPKAIYWILDRLRYGSVKLSTSTAIAEMKSQVTTLVNVDTATPTTRTVEKAFA